MRGGRYPLFINKDSIFSLMHINTPTKTPRSTNNNVCEFMCFIFCLRTSDLGLPRLTGYSIVIIKPLVYIECRCLGLLAEPFDKVHLKKKQYKSVVD